MKSKQIHIIETAMSLFAKQGINAVTMDEISIKCEVSKKTIYEYFINKSALIENVVKHLLNEIERYIRVWPSISPNAISEIRYYFQYVEVNVLTISPMFYHDLIQYSSAYSLFLQFTDEKLYAFLMQNIVRGQAENIYRSNTELIIKVHLWFIKKIISDVSFQVEVDRINFFSCSNDAFLRSLLNNNGQKMALKKDVF
ncbi:MULTISPECIES: TetR/AcrR family transcriptional regulator [unclassified Arcicella]|uniref:TetR/AcrR family transcriptional regulator n=1 Tax=unclassified Arcicella TaxID=2644986 RepID=UPI00285D6E8A|nr:MULTISPECIES: TetR/AcrR family transcriptional regulator [unclassified Arcicella]MDR6562263.1 AcrR family transcriptional regulator [Arcicella sp. BE51]MDR6812043.1 AcrR family transcriptional regulator [Arcicella sp. BE140]MDR6823354.1 AcrR family transcriptional regulator [Arcicella sp. BE139]